MHLGYGLGRSGEEIKIQESYARFSLTASVCRSV
jgi:hypothetical protein